MNSYPLHDSVFTITPYVRQRVDPSILNLRSCELIHPRITEILTAFKHDAMQLQFYPYPQETLERIAQHWKIPVTQLIVSAGSDAIISVILDALGTVTGRLILQTPNYFGWHDYAQLRGLRVTTVSLGQPYARMFHMNTLLTCVRAHAASLVVISNPNSPTGFVFTPTEVRSLAFACAKAGHLLVIDECFAQFAALDHYEILGPQPHIIYVRSCSKSLGLAGMRVAITIASERITQYLARWRPDASVSGPALYFLLKLLITQKTAIQEIQQDIIRSREKFIQALKQIRVDWEVLPSGGNYVVVYLGNSSDDPTYVTDFLYKRGYAIRDISKLPGLEACVRFGIAHWPVMTLILDILKEL